MPPGTLGDGRFVLRTHLGGGGAAEVYRALDSESGHHCAVKMLKLPDEAAGRFRAEGRSMARLKHRHVLRVLASGREPDGQYWIATDLAEGGSLKQLVQEKGKLGIDEGSHLVYQVLRGLHAAHELDIVHRDVKPSNILLDASKRTAFLCDFGIARHPDGSVSFQTATGQSLGSAGYCAPEQRINAHEVSTQADLYAVGATLFHALTGQPAHLLSMKPERKRLLAKLPQPMAQVIDIACAIKPEDRYDDATAMADALLRARDECLGVHGAASVHERMMLEFSKPAPPVVPEGAPLGCLGKLLGLR